MSSTSNTMELLMVAHQSFLKGHLNEAIQLCQKAMERDPRHFKAPELLAIIYHHSGNRELAIQHLRQAIALATETNASPASLGGLYNNLGNMLHFIEKDDEAIEVYKRAIALNPNYLEPYNNLSLILKDKKQHQEAIFYLREALKLNPDYPEAYNTLGIVYEEQYQHDEAVHNYQEALRLKPDFAFAFNNLGSVFIKQGRFDEAFVCYKKALALKPDYSTALYNYGLALKEKGRMNDAIPHYQQAMIHEAIPYLQKALQVQPDFASVHNALGLSYRQLGKLDEAESCFKEAIRIKPRDMTAYLDLGKFYLDQGKNEEAKAVYLKAYEAMPEKPLWKLLADTLCPAFFDSSEEIAQYRQATLEALDSYSEITLDITNLEELVAIDCRPSFYLVYQGMDDLPIKSRFADLMERSLKNHPLFVSSQSDIVKWNSNPNIGFLVTKGHEGLFAKFMGGIINNLPKERFKLSVICPHEMTSTISSLMKADGITFYKLYNHLETDIKSIRSYDCDILFFFEVGTDPENYFLPFFRLAPIQCTSWAIPVTSGIPSVDYYVSSDLLETEESDSYFSEQLIRFRSLPSYYYKPSLPKVLKPREAFGLSNEHHIYFCIQSFIKLHPEFDDILLGILDRDPKAQLVFIQRQNELFTHRFISRLERQKPEAGKRLFFLPWQTQEDFLNSVILSDVILDTIHYGGGTSVYDALSTGTPVVTLPSRFHRGRIASAIYKKMGVTDCIALSKEDYIDIAVRIATDPSYRDIIRQKILDANHKIYEDIEAVREFEKFFLEVIDSRLKRD